MGTIRINQDSLRQSRKYRRFKIEENGDNTYRILPPFGDPEVHNNYPYKYWATVFMVDPARGTRMPFASPKTFGEICPVSQYLDLLQQKIAKYQKALEAKGYDAEKIKEALKPMRDVAWSLNVNGTYCYNACNKSGEIGILELKSTAHKALKKKMSEYIKMWSQDPTSMGAEKDDSGVWFKFGRTGTGKQTEYSCDFASTKAQVDGDIVMKLDRSPIPEYVVQNFDEQGYDLFKMYKVVSTDEIKDILMFNLNLIKDTVPQAILDGWNPDEYFAGRAPVVETAKPAPSLKDLDDDLPEIPQVSKPKGEEIPQGKSKVQLKLDDVDMDVDPVTTTASPDIDLFAEADAILNGL